MGALADLRRDFVEMPLHGLGVAAGQDEAGADAAGGTDGAEDVGRFGALVLGALGRLPRFAQRRVILFFWPIRASSCHHNSIVVSAGSLARISATSAAKFF